MSEEPLRYLSTRGGAPELAFADVLLTGLARDGGLYVPSTVPGLPRNWRELAAVGYSPLATAVMWPFVSGSIERDLFASEVAAAYECFEHPDVVPLRRLGNTDVWLAELFWGPTLAFKDVALQLVGRLFTYELAKRGERVTVLGATSGDTGSAAIEALANRPGIDVVILHPYGRVSEIQRRQMTTAPAPNVANLAVNGTFDDCQDLVKGAFADIAFRDRFHLSAVNSINWARVMAQIVYYVSSAAHFADPPTFVVPTGNFGNVYAGHVARRMGLPVRRFVVASNRNDILTRFFTTATMAMAGVMPTLSPSMDIQVSSNLERLLWEVLGGDGAAVTHLMAEFRERGTVSLDDDRFGLLREGFAAHCTDDVATSRTIRRLWDDYGVAVDPHTAVGLAGVLDQTIAGPTVVLATAHPAKFPEAVLAATGVRPMLPPRLADLLERSESYAVIPNDLTAVKAAVAAHVERDHTAGVR